MPQPPPPQPQEPQVQKEKPQSIYILPDGSHIIIVQQQLTYDWMDVIEVLKGMAPLVGPAPWFFRMIA
ncbi:hypothetical protein [Bdellovibrio svalbardensis]|uniref:Uncharacterized protein n=1 Tax=Bdellovibrio svalbardensis TaxID=2972972 RepID=A0ABT6DEL3_9BACT|nr:hypothetical protein [Bdellovibrio svalbardensis]MDG0815276.1 hypothetical protein [Bdellovibrio svalbardensis]